MAYLYASSGLVREEQLGSGWIQVVPASDRSARHSEASKMGMKKYTFRYIMSMERLKGMKR